jgi:hypothetical protein
LYYFSTNYSPNPKTYPVYSSQSNVVYDAESDHVDPDPVELLKAQQREEYLKIIRDPKNIVWEVPMPENKAICYSKYHRKILFYILIK